MVTVKKSARDFADGFGDDDRALAIAKEMACFREGFVAARRNRESTQHGRDDGPTNNAAALDAAFLQPHYRIRSSRTAEAKQRWDAKLALIPLPG